MPLFRHPWWPTACSLRQVSKGIDLTMPFPSCLEKQTASPISSYNTCYTRGWDSSLCKQTFGSRPPLYTEKTAFLWKVGNIKSIMFIVYNGWSILQLFPFSPCYTKHENDTDILWIWHVHCFPLRTSVPTHLMSANLCNIKTRIWWPQIS